MTAAILLATPGCRKSNCVKESSKCGACKANPTNKHGEATKSLRRNKSVQGQYHWKSVH